jgi:hypothetical protein
MKVTVKIPDQLTAQAKSHELRIEECVPEILAMQAGQPQLGDSQARSAEEIRSLARLDRGVRVKHV